LPTVLLVEDDGAVRKVLCHMLAGLGFAILEAGSAPEALRIAFAHTGAIDLLITDVVMPDTNCASFVGQLKAARPALKVIYISGYSQDVLRHHGRVPSDPNFIQKPFTAGALGRKIREVLGDIGDGRVRSADACR
jgi:two-component system cell cycle sensor histidine kinase/response regulator CckA